MAVNHSGGGSSENRRIARAAGVVGALTLLSRLGGLVRDAVIGYYLGTGAAADAFFVAFRLPNLLRRLVAEGATSSAFVPVFSDYATTQVRATTVRAVRAVGTVFGVGLGVLTVAGVLCAPVLVSLFAPGFTSQPDKLALTIDLTRAIFPYLFLIGLVAVFTGALNALRHFTAPALSPLFLNLGIIGTIIAAGRATGAPVYGAAMGVLIGGVLQVAVHLPPLFAQGFSVAPVWEPRHPAVGRVLWLLAPSVLGTATYQLSLFANTMLASVLPGGSVSYLWYANRISEFPIGLFAVAVGTAALPSFAAQAARGAHAELTRSVSFAVRLTNLITVPAAVGMWCLATPIVSVLFRRGAFGPADVAATASAVVAFAGGLWSVSLVRVLVPAFYALGDTRTPVAVSGVTFGVSCLASLMLMGRVAPSGESLLGDLIARACSVLAVADLRHAGLVWASSLAATINGALLLVWLRRRLPGLRIRPLLPSFLRSSLASALMIAPVRWLATGIAWDEAGVSLQLVVLIGAIAAGIATYGAAMLVIGDEDVARVRAMLRARLRL